MMKVTVARQCPPTIMMNDERERAMPTLNNESNLNDEKVGNAGLQ